MNTFRSIKCPVSCVRSTEVFSITGKWFKRHLIRHRFDRIILFMCVFYCIYHICSALQKFIVQPLIGRYVGCSQFSYATRTRRLWKTTKKKKKKHICIVHYDICGEHSKMFSYCWSESRHEFTCFDVVDLVCVCFGSICAAAAVVWHFIDLFSCNRLWLILWSDVIFLHLMRNR